MTTVSEDRLDRYIAEHPGGPCGHCGTSWRECTDAVLTHRGACCPPCRTVDTHGAIAAEAQLRRSRRRAAQSPTVTVRRHDLRELARRLRRLHLPDVWQEEVAAIAGDLGRLADSE